MDVLPGQHRARGKATPMIRCRDLWNSVVEKVLATLPPGLTMRTVHAHLTFEGLKYKPGEKKKQETTGAITKWVCAH